MKLAKAIDATSTVIVPHVKNISSNFTVNLFQERSPYSSKIFGHGRKHNWPVFTMFFMIPEHTSFMFLILHTFNNWSLSSIQILELENTQLLVFGFFPKYLTLYNVLE